MRRVAFVLVLVACTRKEPPHAEAPAANSVPADAAPAAASAVVDAAPFVAAPPPIPPAPPGADPELVRYAASICAAATVADDKGKVAVGCRSHPPFDDPKEKPDGTIPPFSGDPLEFCHLARVLEGAFSRPGANEAVLVFDACQNDDGSAWDMANPGSAVLVEKQEGRVRVVATDPSAYADRCSRVKRKDGRDLLACPYSFSAPPAGTVHNLFVLDFEGGKPRQTILSVVYSDELSCPAIEGGMSDPADGVTFADFPTVSAVDVDKDGLVDVVVDVVRAHAPPSPRLAARLAAACKTDPSGTNGKSLTPPPKKTRLVFRNDGTTLAPTAPTKKTLETWLGESPNGLHGLPGSTH